MFSHPCVSSVCRWTWFLAGGTWTAKPSCQHLYARAQRPPRGSRPYRPTRTLCDREMAGVTMAGVDNGDEQTLPTGIFLNSSVVRTPIMKYPVCVECASYYVCGKHAKRHVPGLRLSEQYVSRAETYWCANSISTSLASSRSTAGGKLSGMSRCRWTYLFSFLTSSVPCVIHLAMSA